MSETYYARLSVAITDTTAGRTAYVSVVRRGWTDTEDQPVVGAIIPLPPVEASPTDWVQHMQRAVDQVQDSLTALLLHEQ